MMKKCISTVLSLVIAIFVSGCGVENMGNLIEYNQLYDRFLNEKVIVNPHDYTKASFGYTKNSEQGHLSWFYGTYENSTFMPLDYNAGNKAFGDNVNYLQNARIKGNASARQWVATYQGPIYISGKLIGHSRATLLIYLNHIKTYEEFVEAGDSRYVTLQLNVNIGDELIFAVDGDVDFNPQIRFGTKDETLLHYDSGIDTDYPFVGDVHPLYVDGQLRNYYLSTNGRFTADMAISDDLVVFRDTETKTANSNPPMTEGFATRVFVHDGDYYSFYGAYDRFEYTKSHDGYIFENGVGLNENDQFVGTLRLDDHYIWGRDPYAFVDDDINRYRVISMNYVEDRTPSSLPVIDLTLYTSLDDTPHRFQEGGTSLINFGRTNNEPEVPMMIKINHRWYLFACMSGRTHNGVGPLSYWIGDKDTPITEVDWNSKQEQILTGEDLCASQIVEIGGRYYLYGWIAQKAFNSPWGGTINIPQEIFAEEDGTLGVRLDPYLEEKLSKGKISDIRDDHYSIIGRFNKTTKILTKNENETFARLTLDGEYDRAIIKVDSPLINSDTVTGLEITNGSSVFQIRYSGRSNNILVTRKGVGNTYSKYELNGKSLDKLEIVVVAEGNILEVFVNDKYALCARIDETLNQFKVGYYSTQSESKLDGLSVSQLATKTNFQDN